LDKVYKQLRPLLFVISKRGDYVWSILRIALGLIFLWAFFDKLLGLGFATAAESAWLLGNSPTAGFLEFGTHGPFSTIYQGLTGSALVDWFFMLGLLGVGLTLTFGFAIRLGSICGALILFLMWAALIPPEHHPFLDEHLIYLLVLIGFAVSKFGRAFSFTGRWEKLKFVKKHKILR
jgi:thiosulfate dehydrogenase (quinone) large subunit